MVVYSIIIINKAGGLIYQREFATGLQKLSTNDYLIFAGTFHGVHAITRSLTPRIPTLSTNLPPTSSTTSASASASLTNPSTSASLSSTTSTSTTTTAIPLSTSTSNTLPNPSLPLTGLEVLETEKFRLSCFQTITGIKFLLFTDPLMANVDVVMKKVYELYADYVMKNPFYQLEMPVRCEAFDRNLGSWLKGRA